MDLPLMKIKCTCSYEEECQSLGIPQEILKGLIYLTGTAESRDFAMNLAARKLRRKHIDESRFTVFIDTIKQGCPYYKQMGI